MCRNKFLFPEIALLFVILFLYQASSAQWVQTDGPKGAYADQIVQIDSTLILNGGRAIYTSSNDGGLWQLSTDGLPTDTSYYGLTESNGIAYVCTYQGGVYKSSTSGTTWVPANFGAAYATFYTLLADGEELFGGNANGGMKYSPDGGDTWVERSTGLENNQFSDLVKYNGKLYAGGGFTNDENSGLFVTEDNGITWNDVPVPGDNPNGIDSMVADGDAFYVAGDSGIYITKNGGATWNRTNISIWGTVTSMGMQNGLIYATSANGEYYTTENEGVNWQTVKNPQTPSFVNGLHFKQDTIFMTGWDGVYQSIDDGLNWTERNNGIRSLEVDVLTADDDFVYAGTSGQGIFRSGDNGASWEKINNGIDSSGGYFVQDIIVLEDRLYTSTEFGLYFSTDQGVSWTRYEVPYEREFSGRLARDGDVFLSYGYEGRIYVSKDKAQTWEIASTTGLPEFRGYNDVEVKGDTLVIGSFEDGVLISENLGSSWKAKPITTGYTFINNLKFVDNALYAATSQGLFVTHDLGDTWSRILNYDTERVLDFVIEGDLIYAATGNGVQIAQAGRDRWYPYNDGLSTLSAQRLLKHDGHFFVGTFYASVWSIEAEEVVLPVLDDDGDGIANSEDFCPETPAGAMVDYKGCEFIPNDGVYVRTISTTCPNTANGVVEIISDLENYHMNVSLFSIGFEQEFTEIPASDGLIIDNLAPGSYSIVVSIPDASYNRRFQAEIGDIESIIAELKEINNAGKSAVYTVSGSTKYTANVNGRIKDFQFSSAGNNEISLENLGELNTISIKGDNECQGEFEDKLVLSKNIYVYPTISNENVYVTNVKGKVEITLFNFQGQLVLTKRFQSSDSHQISLADLNSGIYFLQTATENKVLISKIVKP